MIKYITKPIKNPRDHSVKYYMQSAPQETVDIKKLAVQIANSSTVARADVYAVLDALLFQLKENLLDGKTVKFDGIGSFYTRMQSRGYATQKLVWETNPHEAIKHVKLCFLRSRELSTALEPRNLEFGMSDAEAARKKAAKESENNG